jgi:Xaa-Pro aminopeptidase
MNGDRRSERQAGLRRTLDQLGLDALLVTHPPNIRYLTGFTGSAALLLVTLQRTIVITDPRYGIQARQETREWAEVEVEPLHLWERLGAVLAALSPAVIGFEQERLTAREVERLRAVTSGRLEPTSGVVEALRASKDPDEIRAIWEAGRLALEALDAVLPTVRPGQTELEIATRLEAALRIRGSEWHPFPTIVASGPRTALPHARTGRRAICPGDLVLLDFGAQVDGYVADLTRTVVVGPADARQREVYAAVRAAQAEALDGIRVGMEGRDADAVARRVLEAAGLGPAFVHSLGHGLGLEVHEDPRLSRTATIPIPANAVVTVEPGVYLEGWGGVRLEDDLLLAVEGPIRLTPGAPELVTVS